MEGGDGSATININPSTIKAAQEEMGRLDVLVCGQCHSVFHFIDEFQEHHSKEGACSKTSHFRENNNNEQKAQVWAFLLWKDTQIQQDSPDKDTANSWKLYQKWCKMDTHIRDCWIMAGKTIQTFTKISNAKMQDVPRQQGGITEGGKTVVVRKVIRNGQPESPEKKEFKSDIKIKTEPIESKGKLKLKPSIKPKGKASESGETNAESSDEEYNVEKILAKRFNPKKKVYEYLLKWENYAHEYNTWEEVSQVSLTCKQLMDEFEKNLAKQKELKAQQVAKSMNRANQVGTNQKIVKIDTVSKAGPSSASQAGRPMRSSKSKAMDQVKQWCGSMKEEDNDLLGKRKITFSDSDSDEDGIVGIGSMKRSKVDTSGDDDWTADSEEDKMIIGRSDVIRRAFSRANAQSNGSNRSSGPMTGTDLTNSMLASNKSLVKIESKPTNSQQSNVYIVHRKDGIIKLDSSPTNKISVKGQNQSSTGSGVLMMQNREGGNIVRKQIVSSASHVNSITPVKVISKADGTQVVTQMKVVPKTTSLKTGVATPKNEPIKIQPKPEPNQLQQIHLVTAVPSPLASIQPQRMTTAVRPTAQRNTEGRPLLPRPTGMTRTPTTTGLVSVVGSTRTPVRAPPPRQLTPQEAQQRKRTTPSSTIVQVSSPNVLTTVRPKITVMNQQGKVIQKTVVSPAQVAKASPKVTSTPVVNKNPSLITPQQKMMMARRKVAQQAGIVSKPGVRAGTKNRGKPIDTIGNKIKQSKLAETDGLHMEFHEINSEESSSEEEVAFPSEPAQPSEPESPPRQFTLCPLTGRIIGPDGEPIENPGPEPTPTEVTAEPTPMAIVQANTINADGTITATPSSETTELVLPTLDTLTDGTTGIVRVEMSPGGTTGTIVQTSDASVTLPSVVVPGPDLPCLDDPSIEVQTTSTVVNPPQVEAVATTSAALPTVATATTTETTTETETAAEPKAKEEPTTTGEAMAVDSTGGNDKLEESGGLVTITGDDGVVYQVTGHAEDGQTLLVTRGADGEQQCLYVTTTEQQGEEGSVLTLDHAVAEAVAQLMPDQVPQFYVKEATEAVGAEATSVENHQMVMSIMDNSNTIVATGQEDSENPAQVVAQVIQADEPTPDGIRRVVLLLPDGNLMMTEVDEEHYAALDLDK